jgi:fumarylpyruvate hydrolase
MTFVIPPTVQTTGRRRRAPMHAFPCTASTASGATTPSTLARWAWTRTREPPFFFTKPADAVVANGTPVPYPPRTSTCTTRSSSWSRSAKGGRDIPLANALAHVFGYAVGNDLTRRDLQLEAREQRPALGRLERLRLLGARERDPAGTEVGHPERGRSGSRSTARAASGPTCRR